MLRSPAVLVISALLLTGCTADETPTASPSRMGAPTPSETTASPSPSPTQAAPSPSPTGPVTAQPPPPLPEDPVALAARITQAERAIRSDAPEPEVAEAGQVQQAAYRHLVVEPGLQQAVLAALPDDLRPVVRAHVDALTDLRKLTRAQPRLPSWRIVAPPPAEELLASYHEGERVFGVGWEYLAAIHLVETRMGRIRGTSPAGAQGPMQFMPQTWASYGEGDIQDPRAAILAAGRYLKASGAPADMNAALFAYNRSQAYVRAIEMHAAQMRADPRTYRGYHHWQVYYRTTTGDRVLPVGYDGSKPAG